MRHLPQVWMGLALLSFFMTGGVEAASKSVIGMANPASIHCLKIGGRLKIRKDKAGNETGYCHLRDGRICEEWALLRDNKCVRPKR